MNFTRFLGDIVLTTGRKAVALLILVAWPTIGEAGSVKPSKPAQAEFRSRAELVCDREGSGTQVDRGFESGRIMPISAYDDDPFLAEPNIECLERGGFNQDPARRPVLANTRAVIVDEGVIYRRDPKTGEFLAFATNPWPLPTAAADGSFRFQEETRFPRHEIERDAAGQPVLTPEGLQMWKPRDLHLGMTTAFEAANKVKAAAEAWAGRDVDWGFQPGRLEINAHTFVDFNAFYSPTARMLFFGVVPYRFRSDAPTIENIKMFEMASSWEVVAHESGHAVHHTLKANRDPADIGYQTWSESFSDQLAMWTSLKDLGRVRAVLAETNGDLRRSNALTVLAESFGALTGTVGGMRDAFNDAKVSTTSPEVHNRSEVLTGAAYRLFVSIYDDLKGDDAERALQQAAAILGTFLTRATDFTPENKMTLEDVAKAYLKVDKELYGGRYHARLAEEFVRRELFDVNSVAEWLAHEAALPNLQLPYGHGGQETAALIATNLDRLGIGPSFGLSVQSVTRDERYGQAIIRLQLTQGRGPTAVPLANHGILVFRADGTLADYHAPLPSNTFSQVQAVSLIEQARRLGLHLRGAPLSIVPSPDGQLTVEARVMRSDGSNEWMDVFTLDKPQGERREITSRGYGGLEKDELLKRAGIVLTADELTK